jgi:hypothetical protein
VSLFLLKGIESCGPTLKFARDEILPLVTESALKLSDSPVNGLGASNSERLHKGTEASTAVNEGLAHLDLTVPIRGRGHSVAIGVSGSALERHFARLYEREKFITEHLGVRGGSIRVADSLVLGAVVLGRPGYNERVLNFAVRSRTALDF